MCYEYIYSNYINQNKNNRNVNAFLHLVQILKANTIVYF